MSHRRYKVWNGATAALTAALAPVATGTSIKTMLQVKPTVDVSIVGWGWTFDVVPTAAVKTELITTGTVAATVTALAAGDIVKMDEANGPAAPLTLGTTASGFTASAEGTITSTRLLEYGPEWSQKYDLQFPLDREHVCPSTDYLRIRMTTAVGINAVCYVILEV